MMEGGATESDPEPDVVAGFGALADCEFDDGEFAETVAEVREELDRDFEDRSEALLGLD